jgi:hypothetical protein
MLFPSLTYHVVLDGAGTEYYGFPLPWNSRGLAASLTKDVYVIPLLVDLMFYGVVSFFVWKWLHPHISRLSKLPKTAVLMFIWLYGLGCSATMMIGGLTGHYFFDAWYTHTVLQILSVQIGSSV